MKNINFFSNPFLFSSLLFISNKSHADIVSVYCATENGSWEWLKDTPRNATFYLNNQTELKVDSYRPPIITTGEWKSMIINNIHIHYFLINGGKKRILELKKECNNVYQSTYKYVQPYSFHLPHHYYYIFGYEIENGYIQLAAGYKNFYSNTVLDVSRM